MAIGLGTAVGYLNLDISGFAKGIDTAMADMDNLNGKFKTTAQGLQTVGGMFTKTGATLTAGFTAPVVGFGVASIKAGTDFDASMSQVAAVSKATGESLELIRDRAIEMGEKTRYTAKEVSDAMYYMGLAGWDAQQIFEGIPGVLALGAASNEELARVSDIVTDSLTAFGKSAEDTSEFVNVLAEATRSSNTTVDLMGESFKYVAPIAGSFGYSIQDIAVALGIFANNGVKGSQAGTGLRQALNSLINPSEKAAGLMDKYGVSLFNADGSTKDFMTVMEELRETFGSVTVNGEKVNEFIDGLGLNLDTVEGQTLAAEAVLEEFGHALPTTDMEKLSAIVKIFGVRALPGMLSVINSADEDFYALSEAIYGAQDAYDGLGTAFGMQNEMMDNLWGEWKLFTSALGTTKVLISDMAKGALRDLLKSLTELVNKFNQMDSEQREQIIQWALIVASIGPVLMVIGKLITRIGKLMDAFKLLKGAQNFLAPFIHKFGSDITGFISLVGEEGLMGTLSGLTGLSTTVIVTIGAIVAVIAVLVAAFVNLWKTNEDFKNRIIEIWEEIKAKFEEAGQRLVEIFNELGFNFEDFKELMSASIEVLKDIWNGFCEFLAPIFIGAFDLVANTIKGIVDLFVGVIEIIVGVVKGFKDGDWSMLWRGIYDVVKAFVDGIIGLLDILGETIWNLVRTVANWFGVDWNMTWEEAKQAVKDWIDSIVKWFKDIPENISNLIFTIKNAVATFVSNIIEWFSQLPSVIGGFFTSVWNSVVQWGANMVLKAIEVGTNFLNNIVQFFSELPNKIAYFIGYALGTIIKWTIDMVNKAREMGANFLQAVIDFFIQLPGNILNFITSAWNYIVQWSTNMVNKAREMARDFLNNIVSFFVQLPGRIYNFITSALNYVVQWKTNMINRAREMAQSFLNNVISFFSQLPGKIQSFLSSVISNVIRWVSDMKSKATEAASGFYNNIVSGLASLPGKMFEIGSNIVSGIWNGISSGWNWLTDKVKGLANSLLQGVKDALGIESPSKEFRDQVGRWIPPGIGEGFEKAMPALIRDMQNELDDGISKLSIDNSTLKSPVEDFANVFMQVFESLVIWYERMEERFVTAVENMQGYLEYLIYVGNMINNDDLGSTVIVGRTSNRSVSVNEDTPKKSTTDGGGDTFIFYSNEQINEIKAARLLKETKRDLAEGF